MPEPSGQRVDLLCGPRHRQGRALQLLPCGCQQSPRLPPSPSNAHHTKMLRRAALAQRGQMKRSVRCLVCYSFPECVSVCLALRLAVWCRVDDPLSSLCLPSPVSPQTLQLWQECRFPRRAFLFLGGATWCSCVLEAWLRFFRSSLGFPAVQTSSVPSAPADDDVLRVGSVLWICEMV